MVKCSQTKLAPNCCCFYYFSFIHTHWGCIIHCPPVLGILREGRKSNSKVKSADGDDGNGWNVWMTQKYHYCSFSKGIIMMWVSFFLSHHHKLLSLLTIRVLVSGLWKRKFHQIATWAPNYMGVINLFKSNAFTQSAFDDDEMEIGLCVCTANQEPLAYVF